MSGPAYRIRVATAADVPVLPAIEVAAGKLFPATRIPDPEAHLPEADLERARQSSLLFVVVPALQPPAGGTGRAACEAQGADDRPVGFAVCEAGDAELHLVELSVHPDHGRRGLGRRLVERVIEEAISRSLEAVTLTTFADLPWNGPFYASMGFEVLSEQALTPFLARALDEERALGLTERVAMRLAVTDDEREGGARGFRG